jgi:lipoyl(octanoyl) transferase
MRRDTDDLVFRELGTVPYAEAWDLQRELAAGRADGRGSDTVLLLEHPDVYTAGRRTQPEDLPVDGTPVVQVDRGGRITWHGPGQLVGYPIVALRDPVDVIAWVRTLEQALIATCADLGVPAVRVPGRSGVWLAAGAGRPERKVAAIGIRITRGVSMHGFALNCEPDLSAFDRIVPCGIRDAGVTSLAAELGRSVPVAEVRPLVRRHVADAIDGRLALTEVRFAPAVSSSVRGLDLRLAPALQSD